MFRSVTTRLFRKSRGGAPFGRLFATGSHQGSALVISLVFIILITIVLVGFVTTAGLERKTVQSHYGKVQADLFNSMAVGVVASRITKATSQTNAWWVSQPGRIAYTPFATTATAPLTTFVDLSSGQADSPAIEDVSVDLNPASLTQGIGLVASNTATSLPVKWIYVQKDGTQVAAGTAAPTYDQANPWVGRYAYWTDDETSRINLNAAASRIAPQNEVATHPSRLDLTALSPLSAADVQSIRTARSNRVFNSVEEANASGNGSHVETALNSNKESVTHFSHSPDLNRFGSPRIVLTTQASLAGGRPFFDILLAGKENTDPGIDANIDGAKITALFAKLYPYFSKRGCDWGLVYPAQSNYWNKTLLQKYGSGNDGQRFAAGIILNLIDYVRSVESAQTLILPLRAAFDTTTGVLTYNVAGYGATGNYGPNALRGNSRRLHIVEMGLWLPATTETVAGAQVYKGKLKLRLYLPTNAGSNVDIVAQGVSIQPVLKPAAGGTYPTSEFVITNAHLAEGNGVMQPGQYRTVTQAVNIPAGTARPSQILMRLAVKSTFNGTAYDFAPLEQSETLGKYVAFNIDVPAIPEAQMTSRSTDDPAVNQCFADWQPKKVSGVQQVNKFGTQNPTPESTLGQATPVGVPQQDADSSGNLTNISTILPSPKGTSGNPLGMVGSIGDLGRVHSGCAGTSVAGKPWRTLRLQPRFAPNGSLPDWVLLDLFSLPTQASTPADAAVLKPSLNNVGGRVNINAALFPFSSTQMTRVAPLHAVLRGIDSALSDATVDTLVANILDQTLATGSTTTGVAFGPVAFTGEKLYSMPGEICEVKGIADGGEESESLARGLTGFFTDRSNVFSVFSVGQKIQQLPTGKIKILGESRIRTMMERYEDGGVWKVRGLSTTELGL